MIGPLFGKHVVITCLLVLCAVQATPDPLPTHKITARKVSEKEWAASDGVGNEVTWPLKTIRGKPNKINTYRGAKRNLLQDTDMATVGFGSSDIRMLRANAKKESGGKYGAINTWDNQIVSWGSHQFAGKAGTLTNLLWSLKSDPLTANAFKAYFLTNGVDVSKARRGRAQIIVTAKGNSFSGREAYHEISRNMNLIGAFFLAGNNKQIALGQLKYWKQAFFDRAVNRRVAGGARIRDLITSEFMLGVIVRQNNWMPATTKRWLNDFIHSTKQFGDLTQPASWNENVERAYLTYLNSRRQQRGKRGLGNFGGSTLSHHRGSYNGSASGVGVHRHPSATASQSARRSSYGRPRQPVAPRRRKRRRQRRRRTRPQRLKTPRRQQREPTLQRQSKPQPAVSNSQEFRPPVPTHMALASQAASTPTPQEGDAKPISQTSLKAPVQPPNIRPSASVSPKPLTSPNNRKSQQPGKIKSLRTSKQVGNILRGVRERWRKFKARIRARRRENKTRRPRKPRKLRRRRRGRQRLRYRVATDPSSSPPGSTVN